MSQDSAKSQQSPTVAPVGDSAVNIEFGSEIDEAINDRVYALADALSSSSPDWLSELVPTYRSLLIHYDGLEFDLETVTVELERTIADSDSEITGDTDRARLVYELPTVYGGEHGPDLESVAEHAGLRASEVVEIHSSTAYRVYMIGFSPGFPYLGGMDERIATPRLSTPRTRVPAGSVGIAESQTGVYPTASPGGWRLIGRTPVRLFDPERNPPSVLQPGHFVRFVPLQPDQLSEIEQQIVSGEFEISVSELHS